MFIRQLVVVLPDNTWVLPIWYCRVPPGFRWIGPDDVSAGLYTRDGGKTWNEKAVPDSTGCVHINTVPLPLDKGYLAFYRSRWADCIYRSTSFDSINWSAPEWTSLPNPNSGICATALPNGDVVMVFNDSSTYLGMELREGLYDNIIPAEDPRVNQPEGSNGKVAIWGTPRKALSVGISRDEGKTWRYRVLEDGDGFCMTNDSKGRSNRELSYPSIYFDRSEGDKGVHISYTHHRQSIRYVHIDDVAQFVGE
ncbi:Uu.00g135470.m01.CDS01 [Anthostomella pinea]|uniref:Uu.00g135470.m01.CDS01 n=1 Tax=Anthostomella pinea TaxID=933095 RepID=A0AAI8YKW4_9PEZI|nr:Uu.00g135470.m01.CDS01 [Anthostomella pinea]